MYLFRLSYYSRNAIKDLGRPVAAEVKQIMNISNLNNPAAGITGGLVFNDHYFAQVLEGDRKARHADVLPGRQPTNGTMIS